MANQKLVNYIKSELSRGVSLEQIKEVLISVGWSDYDVNEAVNLATQQKTFPTAPKAPIYIEPTKKSSNKFWIIPIIVIVIIVIIGGIFAFFIIRKKENIPSTATPPATIPTIGPSSLIDCKTDMDCFIKASENCKLAKVTDDATIDVFGMFITTTTFYEVKGLKEGKCVLYLRTEKQDVKFKKELIQEMLKGGATQEEIQQQEQESNRLAKLLQEGRDGICKFNNNNDLIFLLNKWKDGVFSGSVSCRIGDDGEWECTSTGDWSIADCKGKMFEAQPLNLNLRQ